MKERTCKTHRKQLTNDKGKSLPINDNLEFKLFNSPVKHYKVSEWIREKKNQLYAAYERPVLTLNTHVGSRGTDRWKYSIHILTKRDPEWLYLNQ